MREYKIIYLGYDLLTFDLLNKENQISIVGVGLIEDFLKIKTFNPVNFLFKILYTLRIKNSHRAFELLVLKFLYYTKYASSSIFSNYCNYLIALSNKKIKIVDTNEADSVVRFIKEKNVDVIVVNRWWLLPQKLISAPRFGSVNIHPAKLPRYRGALPELWSLKNHDINSALTYMILDSGMDTGDLLAQHEFPIKPNDNVIMLERKIEEIERKTFINDLFAYLNGNIKPKPQRKIGASNTGKRLEYLKIDWLNENYSEIYNKVLLYSYSAPPAPYCYFYHKKKKIILKGVFAKNKSKYKLNPGQFTVKNFKVSIGSKKGSLSAKLFQHLTIKDSIKFFFNRNGYLQSI